MGHTYTKLWTHVIFSTKDREPLISPSLEPRLFQMIRDHLFELDSPPRIINGMPDHIHILFLQSPTKSLAEIVKNIKGSSSHWVNQHNLTQQKFSWQAGYAAFAVSESQLARAYDYIANQKEHHLLQDFMTEYNHIIELHGLQMDDDVEKYTL